MRILLVNTFYYPNMPGGAEQSVKLLAEGLVKRGHQVAIYAGDSNINANSVEEYNGVTVYRCTTGKFNLFRFSYEKNKLRKCEKVLQKLMTYYNETAEKDFKFVCKDFCPDVVHTNTLYGLPCTVWKEAKKMGIPVVHTIRDTAIVSSVQYGHKVNSLVEKIHHIYMRYYSKFVDGVTAPSEYTLRTSLEIGSFKNVKIQKRIFNSVDLDGEELKRVIEEKSKRTSKKIRFMYAGRLLPIKGIKHMIDSFEQMEYTNCELVICGTGELRQYVEECSKRNRKITYCGKLDNEKLAQKYKECDVLLVPSEWPEPFGRVVIEGNKYGMPVIASQCGGIPEIFSVMRGGELYTAGCVDELKKKMEKFMNRNIFCQYYEEILKKIEVFGIDVQIAAFEEVYRTVCKE